MLYIVYLEDIDDNAEIRKSLLDAHMEHIGTHMAAIKLAGPFLRKDGATPAGGMLLIEADSIQVAEDMVRSDPYCQAGLWPKIRIHAFRDLVNAWKTGD